MADILYFPWLRGHGAVVFGQAGQVWSCPGSEQQFVAYFRAGVQNLSLALDFFRDVKLGDSLR